MSMADHDDDLIPVRRLYLSRGATEQDLVDDVRNREMDTSQSLDGMAGKEPAPSATAVMQILKRALVICDQLEFEATGLSIASAIDALHREAST